MKKFLSLLLTLSLLLGALPTQALALAGDILPAGSGTVNQVTLDDGSLSLQNEYIHVTLRKLWGSFAYFTTVPAARPDEESLWVNQTPDCGFITYDRGEERTEGVAVNLEKAEFVTGTPNDKGAQAIKVEYSLRTSHSWITAKATVYYELVQLRESASSRDDTWGVLASVSEIRIDKDSLPKDWNRDFNFTWGYSFGCFTAAGHVSNLEKPGSPAIKMSRTTVPEGENPEITTESSVFTAPVEKLDTKTVPKGYSEWGDMDGVYITEVYTDGYPWANPFVGLSDYYEKEITSSGSSKPIRVALPQMVSVRPGDMPLDTRVQCESYAGFDIIGQNEDSPQEQVSTDFRHFLWGFHDLRIGTENVPSEPDVVDSSIYARRLAVFNVNGGVTMEAVADDAALEVLKKRYGEPVALINGDFESKNGADFTFTGGAALLSPSVTATWDKTKGKLIIKKDGSVEHSGMSLNAPSFKFYQPNSKDGKDLEIALTEKGFEFTIDPNKNDAIVAVDIPYASVKLERATADAAGNLVFGGEVGFQTIFNGAEFSLKKLGYGLNEKNEFKVNGVHATGSFDTAKLMTLELASVEGEVNTFKGEERYAFSLELNAFDLFETQAKLALERSKKDGSLIPDELWFYVKANPGIPLVPPIPIGQLNGGGAGFKDLAVTVNGDYFAIPPIKLRGALAGTYLHLIEGTGSVVLGPSEISLKATDVGIVGLGESAQIINSFGYSLRLNGQERNYKGEIYKGIYFVGSEELELNLPSKRIDIFVLDTAIKLGAFGGVNKDKNRVYLGIGANGIVKGAIQIPSSLGIPFISGLKLSSTDINLIVGGQTTFRVKDANVSESMKDAFKNVDIYLGAMAQKTNWLYDVRAWVIVPNIVDTNFRMGEGWDIEGKLFSKLPEWDWSEHGIEPVVQTTLPEDGDENEKAIVKSASNALALSTMPEDGDEDEKAIVKSASNAQTLSTMPENGGENTQTIEVNTDSKDETPYILLAFDQSVTEEKIKDELTIEREGVEIDINWVGDDGEIDPDNEINADIDILKNNDGESYRVTLLRLKEDGTYQVNTGSLPLETDKSKGVAITPFEEMNLDLKENQISGEIKYAEKGTKYVLRTYLAKDSGGADYLVDEQVVDDPSGISIDIPTEGTLVPTGNYYVTSFLMVEKEADLDDDGEPEKALAAIDSQKFEGTIAYKNTSQPPAPENVSLKAIGNEAMKASWEKMDGVSGYRVTIYQQDGSEWINTGFGYDLDMDVTSVDMALTVGGNAVSVNGNSATSVPAENLSAGETYKVGVSAYHETEEGAKYYSAETESSGEYLPEYKPLFMTVSVNGTKCTTDENGVYHAYVGSGSNSISVDCADADRITVTRMDTDIPLAEDETGGNTFAIPEFTGTLMLRVDGMKGEDVTSVFLLVSMDGTSPMLVLSDPIFYADTDSGAYTITGTADAGSRILYGDVGKSVYASADGSFVINGNLDERESSDSLYLRAQDSAGNLSAQQLALVARQVAKYSVIVKTDGNGTASAVPSTAAAGTGITLTAMPNRGYRFKEWQVISGGVTIADNEFTMPDENVEIKAIFEEDTPPAPTEYTVTFDGNGGTPSVGSMTTIGQKLSSLPEASRRGSYSFDGWYTEKIGGIKVTTATIFPANTTVYARWAYTGGDDGDDDSDESSALGGKENSPGTSLPDYVVRGGTWFQDNAGRWFFSTDRTYTDEWGAILNPYADTSRGQSRFDWFHFGKDSAMTTGWYNDERGDTFYLNPVSDNTLGRMFTGWNWIDDNGDGVSECYYFQEASDGRRGRLYKKTTTPDGYTVNEKGQWTVDGVVQTKK